MPERFGVAVVGSGIGRSHIQAYRNLPDMFRVIALCDIDTERALPIAEALHIPCVVGDLDEVCGMDDVDIHQDLAQRQRVIGARGLQNIGK